MNGVAHYLFGLFVTLIVVSSISKKQTDDTINPNNIFTPIVITFILLLGFFSHMLVDAMAHFTYHPSETTWNDPVYAGWHLTTYGAEAIFAIYFLRTDLRYVFGMIAAVGFDLWDWSIARPLENYFGLELPGIHFMADMTEDYLFGSFTSFRDNQLALLVEVITVIILFLVWRKWHRESMLGEYPRHGSFIEILVIVLVFGMLRLLTLV